jgi:hypothetical protein
VRLQAFQSYDDANDKSSVAAGESHTNATRAASSQLPETLLSERNSSPNPFEALVALVEVKPRVSRLIVPRDQKLVVPADIMDLPMMSIEQVAQETAYDHAAGANSIH